MTEFGVSAREYLDMKFGHIESGVARIEGRLDGELREFRLRLDAIEKENDERRGRDRSTEAAINNVKWVLAPVIAAVIGLVAKAIVGG